MIQDNDRWQDESLDENIPEQNETEEQSADDLLELEKDKYIRLFAEFENFRKRSQKERNDILIYGNENLLKDLMPVLDDFERAIPIIQKTENEEMKKGIEIIHNKFINVLKNKGLEAIVVNPGDDFDVEIHEAVTQIAAPDASFVGKIVDIIETGYTLNDKVIRFAKVIVGK